MSKCGRPSVGTSVIQGDILTLSHSHTDQDPEHNPVHHDMDYYERFTRGRKIIIVVLISFYGFLSPFSSISVLAATPELAAAFGTTGSIINVSNALYMVFMALSAPVWAPLSQVYGRKLVVLTAGALFFAFSLANIWANNLVAYFVIRMIVAFQGTSFLVLGAAIVGDIYQPTTRGTALSWVLFGGVIGPTLGPLIGGIIITYQPWHVIFIVQAALSGLAFLLAIFFLPETIHYRQDTELKGLAVPERIIKILSWTNPWRVVLLCRQVGILIIALASSSIIWNMYALLTPIRYVLNPRFNLTSPIQSALWYLAPGAGYLVGAAFGGRWSDHTLKKMMKKRNMEIIPEDRLRATFIPLGVIIPVATLIYGWTVEEEIGGIAVPALAMFVQGIGQFFALASLNTYLLDAAPGRSAELIALNYMLRYLFAAGATGAALPVIESIGVGWFSTISSIFLVTTTILVVLTSLYGKKWREIGKLNQKIESSTHI